MVLSSFNAFLVKQLLVCLELWVGLAIIYQEPLHYNLELVAPIQQEFNDCLHANTRHRTQKTLQLSMMITTISKQNKHRIQSSIYSWKIQILEAVERKNTLIKIINLLGILEEQEHCYVQLYHDIGITWLQQQRQRKIKHMNKYMMASCQLHRNSAST